MSSLNPQILHESNSTDLRMEDNRGESENVRSRGRPRSP